MCLLAERDGDGIVSNEPMTYDEMRENAMGWQRRAYRAEAQLAELRAKAPQAAMSEVEHTCADGSPDGGDGTDCPNCGATR